eukprot:CAMPEP_0115889494 /NCGR_PEP_ID=MMETSP0287-20121206/32854_1 /TAXON_ID=412157 /ORGANISM="Chrysochromulina rotalis, Strain UIO044" /LENGTH=66 /DNA_ID=CAMNT_0003346215 /DNA_START=46 /DNA_END=243 /DNA_ORIENTATION=+
MFLSLTELFAAFAAKRRLAHDGERRRRAFNGWAHLGLFAFDRNGSWEQRRAAGHRKGEGEFRCESA